MIINRKCVDLSSDPIDGFEACECGSIKFSTRKESAVIERIKWIQGLTSYVAVKEEVLDSVARIGQSRPSPLDVFFPALVDWYNVSWLFLNSADMLMFRLKFNGTVVMSPVSLYVRVR